MLKTGTAFELNMPKMQIENLVRLSICIPLLEAALGETSFSCVYLRPHVYTSGIFPPAHLFLIGFADTSDSFKEKSFLKTKDPATQRKSEKYKIPQNVHITCICKGANRLGGEFIELVLL
jgi:hypothetical protein